MDIMSVKEASERWNISERWIQKLCEEGRIRRRAEIWPVLDDSQGGAKAC